MQKIYKATYLLLLFGIILSGRLSNCLCRLGVSLFLEFINIVSTLHYNYIKLVMLLYTFLVIYFSQYKKYIIWMISFSKFSDVLLGFTYSSAISNFWRFCLSVSILSRFPITQLHWRFKLLDWSFKIKDSRLWH